MISIGVDIGSTTTKGVVLDGGEVRASLVVPSGNLPAKTAREVLARVMSEAGVTDLAPSIFAADEGAVSRTLEFLKSEL